MPNGDDDTQGRAEARGSGGAPPAWRDRVAFADGPSGPFAYEPGKVVVDEDGLQALQDPQMFPGQTIDPTKIVSYTDEFSKEIHLVPVQGDVLALVSDLRYLGHVAEPNHILFADAECCCAQHPSLGWGGPSGDPMHGNPMHGNPMHGNPMHGNAFLASTTWASPTWSSPVYPSPVYANPMHGNGYRSTGRRMSSARPADAPGVHVPGKGQGSPPSVVVLDTGLARARYLPPLLKRLNGIGQKNRDVPDPAKDRLLAPVAGHGTFVTSLVELLDPGRQLAVGKVLNAEGDGSTHHIAGLLHHLAEHDIQGVRCNEHTLLNLSFSGYSYDDDMAHLAHAIRRLQKKGTVVVASAGNDGTCRRTFPASLPGVIGVAALGPDGPAAFTNYGDWVRACAPGVDTVSGFFDHFNGQLFPVDGPDPDKYGGWARWSGSSFAAPVVVAALAREMHRTGCTAQEAVAAIIDGPGLLRIPGLATVVNIAPSS